MAEAVELSFAIAGAMLAKLETGSMKSVLWGSELLGGGRDFGEVGAFR
jgi:hypothetical protein